MKIGVLQRVLAGYRVPFFDELAARFGGSLTLFAGHARREEMIDESRLPEIAKVYPAKNLHVLPGVLNGRAYFCFQLNVLEWLGSGDPDVLICEANLRYPTTLAAIGWMRRRGRPVIGWGLGSGSATGLFKRAFIRSFDALLTYGERGAETYRELGFPGERIFIAKNAVAPRPRRDPPARSSGFSSEGPLLLSVGRLQARKRIDLLIESCAALESEFSPRLRIVGDGPARGEFERLAAERYPRTEFPGALYGDELAAQFAAADLFVLPGTGGLALQQAMASGLPVIAAEADGTQSDLVRADNGRTIQSGDGVALTAAIRELLTDPARLREMGARSFAIVRDEINLEKMADRFEAAIRFTVAEKSR